MEAEIFAALCVVETPTEADMPPEFATMTTGNKLKDPGDR